MPAAQIVEFARLYGRTKRSFIRVGYGFSRSRNGAVEYARRVLPADGDRRLAISRRRRALRQHRALQLNDSLIEGLDVLDPSTRILDQSRIGAVLTGDKRDLGDGPPVTALFIQNTNPDDRLPRIWRRCARASGATICSSASMSSS